MYIKLGLAFFCSTQVSPPGIDEFMKKWGDGDDKYRVSCRKYLDFIKELQKQEQVNIDKMAEFEYICRNWKTLFCQGLRPSARIGFHQ